MIQSFSCVDFSLWIFESLKHNDAIQTASLSVYIILVSQKGGRLLVLLYHRSSLFSLILCFPTAVTLHVPSILSKIAPQSPGEWTPKWRRVICVLYLWLTEAWVPPPVTALSLCAAGPLGSTTPHYLGDANTRSEKSSPDEACRERRHL